MISVNKIDCKIKRSAGGSIEKVGTWYASSLCEMHRKLAVGKGGFERPGRTVDVKKNGESIGYSIVDLKLSSDQRFNNDQPMVDVVLFIQVKNKITKYGSGHPMLKFFLVTKKGQFSVDVADVSQFQKEILDAAKKDAGLGEIVDFVHEATTTLALN